MSTPTTETAALRIAGAPISWGVCDDGFLPAEPDAMATVLAQHGRCSSGVNPPTGDKTRDEVTLEELTSEMAGGRELAELSHELGGTRERSGT